MYDRLSAFMEQSASLVRRAPTLVPSLMEHAGVTISRSPSGQHLFCHFVATDDAVFISVSDRRFSPGTLAVILVHAGLRALAGEREGLVTDHVSDYEIGGWLAVADLVIADTWADHVLAEELTVEDVAIVARVDLALVHAKIASRAGEIVGPDGATNGHAYLTLAADELRTWLRQRVATDVQPELAQ